MSERCGDSLTLRLSVAFPDGSLRKAGSPGCSRWPPCGFAQSTQYIFILIALYFTYHKIYHFGYDSVHFSTFTRLSNCIV